MVAGSSHPFETVSGRHILFSTAGHFLHVDRTRQLFNTCINCYYYSLLLLYTSCYYTMCYLARSWHNLNLLLLSWWFHSLGFCCVVSVFLPGQEQNRVLEAVKCLHLQTKLHWWLLFSLSSGGKGGCATYFEFI